MVFIELPIFTKLVREYLTDAEYCDLQMHLMENPSSGKVIPGAKGLRKLRWATSGKGKRGGVRVIYYWMDEDGVIYFFTLYKKSDKDDLTKDQLKKLLEYLG